MEPTSFNVGDVLSSFSGSNPASTGFNGADVFQRRRHRLAVSEKYQTPMLQWSRRLSTSETDQPLHSKTRRNIASMEPTSFNVGDYENAYDEALAKFGFNGADVFQRRRPRGKGQTRTKNPASMEPTSFNVGDH